MPRSENNILKEKKKKKKGNLSLSCRGFIELKSVGRIGEQRTERDQSNAPAVLRWVYGGIVSGIHTRIGLWNLANISFSHLFLSELFHSFIKVAADMISTLCFSLFLHIYSRLSLFGWCENRCLRPCVTFLPKLSRRENCRMWARRSSICSLKRMLGPTRGPLMGMLFCSFALCNGHTDTYWERTFISLFNTGWFILAEHKDDSLLRLWIIVASWL